MHVVIESLEKTSVLHIPVLFLIVVVCLLSSSAWLTSYEHPVVETINQRIEDLSGLEMDTAEELQVNNHPLSLHRCPDACKYNIFIIFSLPAGCKLWRWGSV